jgi:hypothetical protein
MRQPKINGRQARWLVYLTPYDFIIKHRSGLSNPADGPLKRPDYKAQREPRLVQKDLLASKLVESNPGLSDTARLDSMKLYSTVMAQGEPSLVQKDLLASKLLESNPSLSETARLDLTKPYNTVIAQGELSLEQKGLVESNPGLSETARLYLELCNAVKCQLCEAVGPIRPELENQLYKTARPELEDIVAGSELIRFNLPEAELCHAARATRRVNAQSPLVDSEGQWALLNNKEAVSL